MAGECPELLNLELAVARPAFPEQLSNPVTNPLAGRDGD
jgi:hypothetical protein